MSDETISQYKLQGGKLVFALINFVEKEFDYDEMANNFADADDDDEIDDLLVSILDELNFVFRTKPNRIFLFYSRIQQRSNRPCSRKLRRAVIHRKD